MKGEREVKNGVSEEEREVKRKRVMERSDSPPPPLGFNNPLLPLANTYDDDDEEEENEQKKSQARGNGVAKGEGNGNKVKGEAQEEVDDDEDDDVSKGKGKHSRHVEVRRDCPYLDTVNRQVINFLIVIFDQWLCFCCLHCIIVFGVEYLNSCCMLNFRCWILILRGFALCPCQI
jgi:U4/U6.U5 tri-snRNP-associated protein 2